MLTARHLCWSCLFMIVLMVCPVCVIGQGKKSAESTTDPSTGRASVRPGPGLVLTSNDKRLTTDPGKAKQFLNQGKRYSRLKLHAEALIAFELAVQLNPNDADAYFGLGQTYFETGRWDAAIDAFERGLRLDPHDKKASTSLRALQAKVREQKRSKSPNPQTGTATYKQPVPKSSTQVGMNDGTRRLPGPTAPSGNNLSNGSTASGRRGTNSTPANQPLPSQDTKSTETAHVNASVKSSNTAVDRGAVSQKSDNQSNNSMAQPAVSPPMVLATLEKKAAPATTPEPLAEKVAARRSNSADSASLEPTRVYRVGIGDILEVLVRDPQMSRANLYTVTATGLLEYPGLVQPLPVVGLTVEEISERLKNELMRLALSENPQILVGVRDYTSHTILISGQVKEPGTKVLRREAIPLYVVLADAQLLPEGERATVISNNSAKPATIDLSDPAATSLLIRPGDVIMVQPALKMFFYIGGAVKIPGEKTFRKNLSLTQAVLMAGGVVTKPKEAEVELAREGPDGLLHSIQLKLRDINSGKRPDPSVQPGDRITVLPD